MSGPPDCTLTPEKSGARLDSYLAEAIPSLSRSRARALILVGDVLVGGQAARPAQRVQAGQEVVIRFPEARPAELIPEAMALRVVYEDEDVAVVDKPAGVAVHPGPGHGEHTLVHGLLAHFPQLPGIGGVLRPGIVHRLDLDTSGLLAVAKSERGLESLARQFKERTIHKGYLALLKGRLSAERGTIDAPIGRHPAQRRRMAIVPNGRAARTRFVVLARLAGFTFVLAMPQTGRTHQLRVHFASVGVPVAGDALYGGAVPFLERQFLHAAFLRFARPSDGEEVELAAPLPADLSAALRCLIEREEPAPPGVAERAREMLEVSAGHFRGEFR